MPTLDQALDLASQLPIEQQDMLMDILRRRQIEGRRDEMALLARESVEAYRAGILKPQTVEDVLKDLQLTLGEDDPQV
jgi:hypothetical protein